jgi:uncharacterized protein involved in outer membrane biogenesis
MPLTRKTKIWLIILAIPVVLLAAAVITLKAVFTSDKLKAMVIPRIEEATHRTVTINDITLAVFPSLGVDVAGFSLANRKGFSPEPFLALDRLHVSVRLSPLLKGHVEVTSLEFDRPRLLIEVNSRNETNYADLGTAATSPAPTQQGKPEAAAAILVNDLRVSDGTLEYISHVDNSATRVHGLQIAMTVDAQAKRAVVSGTATIDSLSYGTVDAALISGLRLGLDHRIVYDQGTDVLTVEKGEITVQDMKMALSGTVSGLRTTKVLNLTIGSDNLNIAELFSLIPREYMKKAEGVKGNGIAHVHLALTGAMTDSATADVSGRITTSGASLQYPRLPKPISDISISSEFSRTKTKQEFRIDKLTANLGNNPVSIAMTVVNFTDPLLSLTAKGALNLAEVGQFYPLEAGTELGGHLTADVHLAGKVKDPAGMKAAGTMTFVNVTAKTATTRNPVRDLNGTVSFDNQLIDSKNLTMNLGKSDLKLSFSLRNYLSLTSTDKNAPKPVASLTMQSNHLWTSDIMGDENAPKPEGKQKPEPAQKPQKTNLPLPNVDMDVNASIGTLTMQKFEFTSVRATMKISNGIITMQNFSLNAFGGTAVSKGSMNMQKPDRPGFDLALTLNSLQANALLSPFTSFGQRLNGTMTMNTTMKGALNDTLGLVPNTLDGSGRVQIQNGSLKGFKVNQTIANALKLPDLETINFKDWTNTFTIQNGRIQVKDLKIAALNAEYVVNGSQGLDGTLDYAMTLFLPENVSSRISIAGFAGEALNLFKDPEGRLKLDFNVGGTTDDPKVQLNTDAAKKRAEDLVKQKVQEEAKKLGDQVKNKAGDVLRDLLKGKKK